jgi:conjugal transfer/entry exclusion protein
VTCVNCSTIWNQLLEYGKQVQQLATQLQSYQTQLQQYANMVTNTLALPQQLWGQVQGDIMQVRNLSNAASLLSGNAGSIVTRLQQNQQGSDAALLASLEQHSQSAQGQMQAMQAGNELAHATAVQLQQIQATLAVTAQMRATEMAVDADRRASQDAAMLHFSTPVPVPTSGYRQY